VLCGKREQYEQITSPIAPRQDGELLVIVEPVTNDSNGDFMNAGIAQISSKPPPISRQAGHVTSVTSGLRFGRDNF
jgi:hypothetical protein